MPDPFAAALPAFREVLGEQVVFIGAGLAEPTIVAVIWSDIPGDPFQGAGNTTRTITAEISRASIPARPTKTSRITRKGVIWKPIQVTDRDDVDAWVVTLERA